MACRSRGNKIPSKKLRADDREQLTRFAMNKYASLPPYQVASEVIRYSRELGHPRGDAVSRFVANSIIAQARERLRADLAEAQPDLAAHVLYKARLQYDTAQQKMIHDPHRAFQWSRRAAEFLEIEASLIPKGGESGGDFVPTSMQFTVVDSLEQAEAIVEENERGQQ